MVEIAHIIHITDMHLFVDRQGNPRPAQERAMFVRMALWLAGQKWGRSGIQKLADGLNAHSRLALQALVKTLQHVVIMNRRCPLVLIQTGDMEAYGGTEIPHQSSPLWEFPAFDYWRSQCGNFAANVELFVDIYGNHDVWPRTLPLFRPRSVGHVEKNLRNRPEFTGLLPDCVVLQSGNFFLEFYRLNTIQSGFLRNTIADGRLSVDSGHTTNDLSSILSSLGAPVTGSSGTTVIRFLMMHHPPHFFNSGGMICDLLEGQISNVNELLPALKLKQFHLILAGHRHSLDPAPGGPRRWQRPLPSGTLQLVADSAAQFNHPSGARPSFNLYLLFGDNGRRWLFVHRVVYRFRSDLDTQFRPDPVEQLSRLPL